MVMVAVRRSSKVGKHEGGCGCSCNRGVGSAGGLFARGGFTMQMGCDEMVLFAREALVARKKVLHTKTFKIETVNTISHTAEVFSGVFDFIARRYQ